jgi:hypothetical protein
MKQADRGTPEHHKKQKEGTKTPPAANAPPTESFAQINTHRVNPPPSPQRVLQPPPHPHPTPRYRVTHPPSLVAPTPETAHLPFHTEPQQYPVGDPPPQTTQPEATTMEAHQSTPSDTDDHMEQENPAAARGQRFDPHSKKGEEEGRAKKVLFSNYLNLFFWLSNYLNLFFWLSNYLNLFFRLSNYLNFRWGILGAI